MNIYWIAAIYKPGPNDKGFPVLALAPESVLAKTEKAALAMATRKLPDVYADRLDDVEIIVRPF